MSKSANFIVRYRVVLVLALLLLTFLCIPGLFRLNITVDIADYFLSDDPVISAQKAYEDLFPSRDFIGVLVEGDDVLSAEGLEMLRRLGLVLENSIPESERAVSPATLSGALTGGVRLVFDGDNLVSSAGDLDAWRAAVSASPLLNGLFFSGDFSEAWVILPLSSTATDIFEIGRLAWDAVKSIDTGTMKVTPAGLPVFAYRKQVELMDDLVRVLIFGAIAAVILSAAILRSFRAVAGTLAVFIFSVVVTLGWQGWAGLRIDNAFMSVPILLIMGVSVGYSVHIHRFFHLGRASGLSRQESVVEALNRTIRPVFFSAFTTLAALLSFLSVNIKPIRWVGFTSAIGILTVFLFTVILFPAVLTAGRDGRRPSGKWRGVLADSVFQKVATLILNREISILLVFILASVVAAVGVSKLKVDFDAVKMMGTRLPHMQDQIRIGESEIAVGEFMNLVVSMPEGSFRSAESVMLIEMLEKRVADIPGVTRVRSVTGVLKEVNSLLHGRSEEYTTLPDNDVSLELLIRLLDRMLPDERRNWMDDSFGHARLLVEITDFSSRKIELIIGQAEAAVTEVLPENTGYLFSGSTYMVALMNQYITRGLVRSVVTSLVIICLIMMMVFRSVRWGLVAMIPNVFPVIVAGSILGFAGIPLEFVTMTVAPIILGLAVDDTIHFMSFLKDDMRVTHQFPASLQRSLSAIGAPITEASLILCVTFLVFFISEINSIRYMGLLAASGMAAAYLADLLVTPILVRLLTRRSGAKSLSDRQNPEAL